MSQEAERHERARAPYDELIVCTPAERTERLAVCTDSDLRRSVEERLAATDPSPQSMLLTGKVRREGLRPFQTWQGRRLGAFELLSLLGQGGMGSVWLAERRDGDFDQRVAIKLIAAHASHDPALQRRFATEREILAALDHPGIARLIDGGETEDGAPYLVMEYIDGEPIDRWCQSRNASFDQRISLVIEVAEALQAAHAALIVHRDLKPANILVDRRGRARLLDFGIAKPIDPSGLKNTVIETAAEQRVMTLRYASPEQVRGERIGTASDIYTLGVVLYELLTGQSPYAGDEGSSLNLMQAICSAEPRAPSHLLADAAASGPLPMRSGLAGDLDAIVLKALRKQPGERYVSATAFADDLRRLIDGQPVAARHGDRRYRARKFVRRHRLALTLAGLAALLLAAVAINWRWQRDALAHERDKAVQTTRFLTDLFQQANPANHRGEVPDAIAMAERGADSLLQDRSLDPDTRATLLRTASQVLIALGAYPRALAVSEAGLRDVTDWRTREPALYVDLQIARGEALSELRRYDEAVAVLGALHAAPELNDQLVAGRALRGEVLSLLAAMAVERKDYDTAERTIAGATLAWQRSYGTDPEQASRQTVPGPGGDLLASILLTRCRLAVERDQLSAGRAACNAAQDFRLRHSGPTHPATLNALIQLASLAGSSGDPERALALTMEIYDRARAIYGPDHPHTGVAALNLGVEFRLNQRYDDAVTQYAEAHRIFVAARGPDHPHALMALNNWANVDYTRGDYASALKRHREVQARRRQVLPTDSPDLVQSATNVAKCLWRLGQIDAAEAELRSSPAAADIAAGRPQRLLLAHLALARGDAAAALRMAREVDAELKAAAPDVRGLAASAWIETLALAALDAAPSEIADALTRTQAALQRDDGREFVRDDEVAAWPARKH